MSSRGYGLVTEQLSRIPKQGNRGVAQLESTGLARANFQLQGKPYIQEHHTARQRKGENGSQLHFLKNARAHVRTRAHICV